MVTLHISISFTMLSFTQNYHKLNVDAISFSIFLSLGKCTIYKELCLDIENEYIVLNFIFY